MREELKSKLEFELKKSKRKNALLIGVPFLLFAVLIAFIVPYSTTLTEGITVRRAATPTEYGNLPRAMVELNRGKIVRAKMPRQLTFIPEARVVLQQSKTLSGLIRYRICLLYTSPSPRDATLSRMPSSA